MRYAIEVVGDRELPEGTNAVIVERENEPTIMLINGLPARVWALMRAWEDTQEPEAEPSNLIPLRLVSSLGIPVAGVVGRQGLGVSV